MVLKEKILFTTIPSNDHEKKNLLFLDLIRKHKSTSRTEISKLTNFNVATISNYINGYLKKGLIVESGYETSSGGRRPELVELNKEWGCVSGIDIGTNYINGILANLSMEILASESIHGYEKKNLKFSIDELLKKLINSSRLDKAQIKKVGICSSANVTEEIIKLRDAIEREITMPVLIGDGVLCAASGEKNLNPEAAEASSILYVYTDLGKVILIKDDEFCTWDKEGSEYVYLRPWNQKLSIVNEAKKIIEKGVGSKMVDIADGDIKSVTIDTVIKAARGHDEVAIDLLRVSGMNLGVRIAYLINLFEPNVIIIGGGVEKAGEFFLKPLTESVNRFILQRMLNKVKLTPAVLEEAVCVKGAASLAAREVFIEA